MQYCDSNGYIVTVELEMFAYTGYYKLKDYGKLNGFIETTSSLYEIEV
jgi:hypothetical protein